MNFRRFLLQIPAILGTLGVMGWVFAYTSANAIAQTTTVYKHTDQNGRVTYSNSPIKGAVIIELAPQLIMPADPKILGQTKSPPVVVPAETSPPKPIHAVTDLPPRSDGPAAVAAPPPPVAHVSTKRDVTRTAPTLGVGVAVMAQQRRDEVRRRIIEGEIEAEEQLLREAETVLAVEQSQSGAIRALRATLTSAGISTAAASELKTHIARHFARVRDLQDQVDMHLQNARDLRTQLADTYKPRQMNPQLALDKPPIKVAHADVAEPAQTPPAKTHELRVVKLKPVAHPAPRRSLAEDR